MKDAATDITRNLIRQSGIKPGMQILDVGCGPGEVSFLLAEHVGQDGAVIGVDRNERVLALAEASARERSLTNVSFIKGDLIPDNAPGQYFDAAFGRRVIMYQPDAVAAISRIVSVVKPGGVIAFQEHDASNGPSLEKAMPVHSQVHTWLQEMLKHEGGNLNIGMELFNIYSRCGLKNIDVRAEAVVLTPEYDARAPFILKMVWSRLLNAGVLNEEEHNLEAIIEQLAKERKRNTLSAIWDIAFLAIAVK